MSKLLDTVVTRSPHRRARAIGDNVAEAVQLVLMGTVSDYLATLDESTRPLITSMMDAVRREVPDVTEGTSYGMPALMYKGKPLVAIMATKKHIALYPFSGGVVTQVADRLEGFALSSGTIRFSTEKPLPDGVLTDILAFRVGEIEAGTKKK